MGKGKIRHYSFSNVSRVRVRASISGTSPRDSTFNRTTGSVLEERRLKRQSAKVMLMPSVRSTASASRLKCCSTRLIALNGLRQFAVDLTACRKRCHPVAHQFCPAFFFQAHSSSAQQPRDHAAVAVSEITEIVVKAHFPP